MTCFLFLFWPYCVFFVFCVCLRACFVCVSFCLLCVFQVRDIVVDVYESRYGRALGAAKGLTLGAWALDLHLAPHAELLRKRVYDRCVLQYFLPYKSVSLVKVAAAFDSDVAEVTPIQSTTRQMI